MPDELQLLGADAAGGQGSSGVATFRRRGEYWALDLGGSTVLLRDAKGLHYLAELLRRSGEKISAVELAAEAGRKAETNDRDSVERARSAVTKRIRDAVRKIERNHPALGRHLSTRIKTGYECIYSPDPDQPVIWEL